MWTDYSFYQCLKLASGNRIAIPKCGLVQVCAFLVKDHLREFTNIQRLESNIKFWVGYFMDFSWCVSNLGTPWARKRCPMVSLFKNIQNDECWMVFNLRFQEPPRYTYQGISGLCKSCCDCLRLGAKIGLSHTVGSPAVCWEERFSISKGHWPLAAQLGLPSPSWPNQRCGFVQIGRFDTVYVLCTLGSSSCSSTKQHKSKTRIEGWRQIVHGWLHEISTLTIIYIYIYIYCRYTLW